MEEWAVMVVVVVEGNLRLDANEKREFSELMGLKNDAWWHTMLQRPCLAAATVSSKTHFLLPPCSLVNRFFYSLDTSRTGRAA